MHSVLVGLDGERVIDQCLACLAVGTELAFEGEEGALGSTWCSQGSSAQISYKRSIQQLVNDHAVRVVRPIPALFCGDGFPFGEGSVCECLEFQGVLPVLLGKQVQLKAGYPAVKVSSSVSTLSPLVNLLFLGHTMHRSGTGGFHATHRCHNSRVRTTHQGPHHPLHILY
jgi:hypothetical protein